KLAAGRLKAKGAMDAVLIADNGRIAALAAPMLPGSVKLMGTDLWASDKLLGKTPALRGAWYAAAPDGRFAQLSTRYRARYGKAPYRLASLGYDAVLLAVRSSRSWPMGRPFPARTLLARDGFAGVDGNFRFGGDGIAERLLEVREVTPTGTSVVARAGTAF
ncbi:MAG: penicillin-binding protein activator, partial [Sphingomicrobium sp.]